MLNIAPENASDSVVERLMHVYERADNVTEQALRRIYSSEIVFKDPVNCISGIDTLVDHTLSLYRGVTRCDFDYDQENLLIGIGMASIPWVMNIEHSKLNRGRQFEVRGVSVIRYQEKVEFQEDFYDLGAAIYERVPVLSALLKPIKHRLKA